MADEVEQWQTKVDALNATARKLLEEYSGDDTAKVKDSIDKTNARWTQLLSRWVKGITGQAERLSIATNWMCFLRVFWVGLERKYLFF